MPSITLPNGRKKYIPGVYFDTKIRSSLPGPLPSFMVPVIMGSAWEGKPYNADSLVFASETRPGAFTFCGTADLAGELYGRGSDIHRAFVWAQRHGLPGAYVVSLSALTRASIIADATSVNQATVYAKKFGAPGNWIKVSFTGGTLTVQGLKNFAFLRSNLSGTGTRVELKGDTSWIVEGGTYSIGDNSTTIGTVTVARKLTEYDSAGQPFTVIETTAAFGSAITTALYAMVAEYAVGSEEVISGITTGQLFIDLINLQSQLIGAHKHANFTNATPDTIATLTPLKQVATWLTFTAGISPAAGSADVTAWVSLMNTVGWEDFLLRYKDAPQAYLLAMGDSTSHGLMRDYALAERNRGWPISVTTGVRWGDTVVASGTDTDPKFRTAALNSQDVALCAPGLDYEAAYLSMAGAIFGRRISGGPGHNLTNDELLFSVLEDRWNEINGGELTTLLRAGVCTVKLSVGRTIRYRVAEGVSTLQSNEVLWNPSTKDTWSLMSRDLADFVNRVLYVDLEEDIVGADGVTASVIAATLRLRAEKVLIPNGYITEYTITSIALNAGGNGYDVRQSARYPSPIDFVFIENTILVG